MASLEIGLLLLVLTALGVGSWMNQMDLQQLSATIDTQNVNLRARNLEISKAEDKHAIAVGQVARLQQELSDFRKGDGAAAEALGAAQTRLEVAEASARDLQNHITTLENAKKQLERDKNTLVSDIALRNDELANLKKQLSTALQKDTNSGSAVTGSGGLRVGDATRGVIGGANPGTSGGTAGKLATSADTTVAGQADPLYSLLRELSTLYRSTDATSKSEDFLQRLSVSVNGLNQTQVDALKLRGASTNLESVWNYISGKSMPQLLLQRSAELDFKFGEALSKQVEEFLKKNALIKFQPSVSPANNSDEVRWHWIRLGEVDGMANVDKSLDALCKRLEDIDAVFLPTPVDAHDKSGAPHDPSRGTYYRFVDNLAAYPDGLNIARGVSGRMFADAKDGPFEKPQQVKVLVWPSRQELSGNTKPKLDDLIKLLSSIGNKAVLTRPRSDQNQKPISVDTPTFVAWEFAKSCLMTSSQYCSMVPVKGWIDQLVAVLEKNENGAQMNYVENMREFRQRLLHPPFFRAVPQNGFTTHFVGALSVSGGDIKIVKPVGDPDERRTGDLAVVDGTQFRHIGELKDGEPVFDALADRESLLGCAVFVVESKQKPSPSK